MCEKNALHPKCLNNSLTLHINDRKKGLAFHFDQFQERSLAMNNTHLNKVLLNDKVRTFHHDLLTHPYLS